MHYYSWYSNFFRNSLCADELYFHTIIMNLEYGKYVKNTNLRYIDWNNAKNGSPKMLEKSDIEKAIKSENIFARKVGNVDVIDYAYSLIKDNN